MKLGIIAGNRYLPLLVAQRIKQQNPAAHVTAICFKGETDRRIAGYCDSFFWLKVGELERLVRLLKDNGLSTCIMAGQISPTSIFYRKHWDDSMRAVADSCRDFRPHAIFQAIIAYLGQSGISFQDSTFCLQNDLSTRGFLTIEPEPEVLKDIEMGVAIASRYVELDVGQTLVVKHGSVLALEALEGTDRTIQRAHCIGGTGTTVIKFAKHNQDLRFDVPVVGLNTLRLLSRLGAVSLVLEAGKVIILEKQLFLSRARALKIAVVGREKVRG